MDPKELVREGNLRGALDQLQNQVRSDPGNVRLRIFLFELLSLLGEWDRALKQLDVLGELDAESLALVHVYRDGILCERLRASVFEGARSPLVFGEPEAWVASLAEGLKVPADSGSKLADVLAGAYEQAPDVQGTLNGEAFTWIGDADARLGPILEAVINGKYYWVPFFRIAKIMIDEPQNLREYVWTPATFLWTNGGEAFGLIPTRYVGSETSEDALLQAARGTAWNEFSEGMYTGTGQRMIATDNGDYSLMDIREIVIRLPEA